MNPSFSVRPPFEIPSKPPVEIPTVKRKPTLKRAPSEIKERERIESVRNLFESTPKTVKKVMQRTESSQNLFPTPEISLPKNEKRKREETQEPNKKPRIDLSLEFIAATFCIPAKHEEIKAIKEGQRLISRIKTIFLSSISGKQIQLYSEQMSILCVVTSTKDIENNLEIELKLIKVLKEKR